MPTPGVAERNRSGSYKKDVGGVTAKMTSRDEVDWVERKSR
jgi:hypothetical protein